MKLNFIFQYFIFISILTFLSINLGEYIYKVKAGEEVFTSKFFHKIEKFIYNFSSIDLHKEMGWKEYSLSLIFFHIFGIVFLFLIQIFQFYLPLNPENFLAPKWYIALNTAISFITNTNWQSYSGEKELSYFVQMIGLTSQNFISPSIGLAVFFAFIRSFTRKNEKTIGNFWKDIIKIILYIFIPLSLVVATLLLSQGVIQNFSPYISGGYLEKYSIPMGPVASQVAIKQLGTNGGGFFGVNSAHPFENPTSFSNFIELLSILLIPCSLCFAFGKSVKNNREGWMIYSVMLLFFTIGFFINLSGEIGNMEGKELRNGIFSSALWSTATTATSNGSINSMHESYSPQGVIVMLFFMQIGEIIFGGVGTGTLGMLIYVLLTVFIGGLMVGRTPEYLKNKIEAFEIKMISLILLIPPISILLALAITVSLSQVSNWLSVDGISGFTELYYNFISAGNNNGSSFSGYHSDNLYNSLVISLLILIGRFTLLICSLAIAGNIVKKKHIPVSSGTLKTDTFLFATLLILIIITVGALIFFPALALGPIIQLLSI